MVAPADFRAAFIRWPCPVVNGHVQIGLTFPADAGCPSEEEGTMLLCDHAHLCGVAPRLNSEGFRTLRLLGCHFHDGAH